MKGWALKGPDGKLVEDMTAVWLDYRDAQKAAIGWILERDDLFGTPHLNVMGIAESKGYRLVRVEVLEVKE